MNERFIREIFYYKHYYLEFFNTLRPAVQKKFNWTLQLIATVERIPVRYFEHITNSTGLFEIRVEVGSDIFKVFSFFDKGNLIILVNGFQKKTQKTPAREIELAEKLKDEYLKGQEARPESTKKNKKT
jgi:phage-related protein